MSNNVKISQLNDYTVIPITGSDFFPLVQSSSLTTYKISVNNVNAWLAQNGSASYSTNAVSASYVKSSSISNRALTASYLDFSIPQPSFPVSNSWSSASLSSSYAKTASYALFAAGNSGGTVNQSNTASNLNGIGTSTEQIFIVSSSFMPAVGARLLIPYHNETYDYPYQNSIYFNRQFLLGQTQEHGVSSNDYGVIHYTETTVDRGRLVFSIGDNLDPTEPKGSDIDALKTNTSGFEWQQGGAPPLGPTASIMFLSTAGRLYTRTLDTRVASSSVSNAVGFYGTASWAVSSSNALTASYVANNVANTSQTAFGTFYIVSGNNNPASYPRNMNFIPFASSSNFVSGTYIGVVNQVSDRVGNGMLKKDGTPLLPTVSGYAYPPYGSAPAWIFNLKNPMPSINYTVVPIVGGEIYSGGVMKTIKLINNPTSARTTTAFTMSMIGLTGVASESYVVDFSSDADLADVFTNLDWVSLMVLHP